MKTSYVARTQINITFAKFYVAKGDLLVFDPARPKDNLSVFRGGKLVKTLTHTPGGLASMTKTRMIELVRNPPSPGKVEVKRCPNCGIGTDTDGDGDCAACAAFANTKAGPSSPATAAPSMDAPSAVKTDDPSVVSVADSASGKAAAASPEAEVAAPCEAEQTEEAEPNLETMLYTDLLAYAKTRYGISLAASSGRKRVIAAIAMKKGTGAPAEESGQEDSEPSTAIEAAASSIAEN